MEVQRYTYSDTIAGYVTEVDHDAGNFKLKTSDNSEFQVYLTPTTYARITQNLEESYQDCTARIQDMLQPGQQV
ncbi:MAG: hypothetical protein KDJ70_06710 [Candidatus Competibacteraceae bacterium]|nr:hypothetical protein [Candidatus Competibacteraceae bacterium]